jgi:hypothetical protein
MEQVSSYAFPQRIHYSKEKTNTKNKRQFYGYDNDGVMIICFGKNQASTSIHLHSTGAGSYEQQALFQSSLHYYTTGTMAAR